MPSPVEDSKSVGGSAQFFEQVENWLNHDDETERQKRREEARNAVLGNLSGVPTDSNLSGPPAKTFSGNPGINHFNNHWRGGSSGWWPNITKQRVSKELADAFASALHKDHLKLDIRLRWDCSNIDVGAGDSSFYASVRLPEQTGEIWIDITSPRAP